MSETRTLQSIESCPNYWQGQHGVGLTSDHIDMYEAAYENAQMYHSLGVRPERRCLTMPLIHRVGDDNQSPEVCSG
jgi:hypothetical protein